MDMPDPVERFIAAATAPLEDNAELHLRAAQEFQGMIAHHETSADGSCDSLEACAARLEALPVKVPLLKRMAVPAVACIALALAGLTSYHFYRYQDLFDYDSGSISLEEDELEEELLAPNASPHERLLLFGDPSAGNAIGRWKSLWSSDPQNASYFAHYARTNHVESKKLPPGYRETAAQLDPGNGYFMMLEAAVLSRNCVEVNTPKRKRGEPRPASTYVIKDQARMDESIALMQRAAGMPEWRTYEKDFLREQLAALPEAPGILEGIGIAAYFDHRPYAMADISFAVAAKAEQLAAQGDRDGFLKLVAAWEQTTPLWLKSQPGTLMSIVIGKGFLIFPLANLKTAAEKLGMGEVAAKFQAREAAIEALAGKEPSEEWASKMRQKHLHEHGSHRLSQYGDMESYLDKTGEWIPDEALKPGRRAEFELVYQASSIVACAVFGIAGLLVAAYRFRGGLMARRLSRRMSGLLTSMDRAWIIGGGVVAPFLTWQLASRFTPLGAKDWGPERHGMIVPVGQWLACVVLMLALPVVITRWRLNRRAGRIMSRTRRGWIAVGFTCLAVVAILVFWIAFKVSLPDGIFGSGYFLNIDIADAEEPERSVLYAATGLVALALGWLMTAAIRAIASSYGRMLRRVTTSRVLVQAYVAAMLTVALALPFFRVMEEHWVAQDRLTRVTADSVPGIPYSATLARSYRQRLLNIFETKE